MTRSRMRDCSLGKERFLERARARLARAERRLLAARAAACFYGLEFLNGRLLDTARLDALSLEILQAEEEWRSAAAALTRILPDAPRPALQKPEALELLLREIERLSRVHGQPAGPWPRAELEEMAEALLARFPFGS